MHIYRTGVANDSNIFKGNEQWCAPYVHLCDPLGFQEMCIACSYLQKCFPFKKKGIRIFFLSFFHNSQMRRLWINCLKFTQQIFKENKYLRFFFKTEKKKIDLNIKGNMEDPSCCWHLRLTSDINSEFLYAHALHTELQGVQRIQMFVLVPTNWKNTPLIYNFF